MPDPLIVHNLPIPADMDARAWDHAGDTLISVSGGKDSTATALYLERTGFIAHKEAQGFKVIRAFADTGWELPETYQYLATLEARIGKIHRIATWVPGPGEAPPEGYDFLEPVWKTPGKTMDGDRWALAKLIEARLGLAYSAMIRLILHWGKVPTSVRRWCTEDTKKRVLVAFLAALNNPLNTIGVRAEESSARAAQPAFEWSEPYDAWVWRPLHSWRLEDVIDEHKVAGIAPNPLYLQGTGAGRVGCAPCVYSGKKDIRWLAEAHPERLAVLAELEEILSQLPTPYEEAMGTSPRWFILNKVVEHRGKISKVDWPVPVQEAVEWANTARGGKQAILFRPEEAPGCASWGMCPR